MNQRLLKVLVVTGAALALMVVLSLGLQMAASAQSSATRTCPWNGVSDSANPTWEDWGGSFLVNGLPGPVGSEVEMRSTTSADAVSCFRTLLPGGWGISRITNGSTGFFAGEQISMFADGFPAQPGGYYYTGDGLGHSMTVTTEIPQWSITVIPPLISTTVSAGEFKTITVTVANTTMYPSYFSSAVADGWDWSNMCVWPTTDPQNILRAGQSMTLTFSINSLSCANGFNSAIILAETHPVVAGAPQSVTLPIAVAMAQPESPTATPEEPTATPTPTPTNGATATPVATNNPTPTPAGPTATPEATPLPGDPTPTPTPTDGATATPSPTPLPTSGWIEIQPVEISRTIEYVSNPLILNWSVKNLGSRDTSFTAVMLQPVDKPCFSNSSLQVTLAQGETKTFTTTATSSCLGAGVHARSYQLVEQVPISVAPRTTSLPIKVTVLPNPWEVKVTAPGAISATDSATFTMEVKNIGDHARLGAAQVYVDSSAFITTAFQINTGQVHATPIGEKITRLLWAFEVMPGETATFTSSGVTKAASDFQLFTDTWRWERPDLETGAASLAVFPNLHDMIYLPVVSK